MELHVPDPPPFEPGDSPVTGTADESEKALEQPGVGPGNSLLEKLVNPHGNEAQPD